MYTNLLCSVNYLIQESMSEKLSLPCVFQIVLNFTEECSKVTSTVRLQSFTYDYHLKCIERYLLGQTSYLPRDYHVTSFLEDFLKFYPNLPASSSCCLHTGWYWILPGWKLAEKL